MNFDSLKQLTLFITIISIVLIIFSIINSKKLWKFTLNNLKSNVKDRKYQIAFLRILLIFLTTGILITLSYTSIDIANKIAQDHESDYLGNYDYAYRELATYKDINSIVKVQKDFNIQDSKIGIFGNFSVSDQSLNIYEPNVSLLAFDDLDLKDNSYISFGENSFSNNLVAQGIPLILQTDIDKSKLNGLEEFRGWDTQLSSKSKTLIVTNLSTAKRILNLEYPNVVFTNKELDLSIDTLTKDIGQNKKTQYFPTVLNVQKQDYKNNILNEANPFPFLLILTLFIYIILIYPLYRSIRSLSEKQIKNFEILRSTGATSGIVMKYLTFYFFVPFIVLIFLTTLLSLFINIFLYKFLNLNFLFGNYNVPSFFINWTTPIFIFTNLFALFFLIIFLIFYSVKAPMEKFKGTRLNVLKLSTAIALILFGPVVIFSVKDIPSESRGIIPFVIAAAPVFSLAGVTVFLRFKNKIRQIVLFAAGIILAVGSIVLYLTHQISATPSGIIVIGVTAIVLLSFILNELKYRDFAKTIAQGISIFITVFIIILSSTGFSLPQKQYDFDMSAQTYSVVDKRINYDRIFKPEQIISKVSFGRTQVMSINDNNNLTLANIDIASVPKNVLISTNLTDEEKDRYYASNDLVILSPEFKQTQDLKENDLIKLRDLSSGQEFTRKVFKILDTNSNQDISNKIIFPELQNVLTTAHSSLNTIYLLKTSDTGEKEQIKQLLNQYNMYDYVDVGERLILSLDNSKNILGALINVILILQILLLVFSVTRNLLKGIINIIVCFGIAVIFAFYYEHITYSSFNISVLNLLIILILSAIILYGTNFTVRKLKNNK